MEDKKEILTIDDKCKIEFDELGNIKIGEGCKDSIINPVELGILNKSNIERGAR